MSECVVVYLRRPTTGSRVIWVVEEPEDNSRLRASLAEYFPEWVVDFVDKQPYPHWEVREHQSKWYQLLFE